MKGATVTPVCTHAERGIEHDDLYTRVPCVGEEHIKQMNLVILSTYFKESNRKIGKTSYSEKHSSTNALLYFNEGLFPF